MVNSLFSTQQSIQCNICCIEYNGDKHKPMVIGPCGHGACQICLDNLEICHICRESINSRILNRDLLDRIDLVVKERANLVSNLSESSVMHLPNNSQAIAKPLSELNRPQRNLLESEPNLNELKPLPYPYPFTLLTFTNQQFYSQTERISEPILGQGNFFRFVWKSIFGSSANTN